MSMDKIKLFNTVLKFHERGDVALTASEKSLIETETRDLLSAASRKQAGMAPEGFESLLMSLKSAENADDAFEMVVKFLGDTGVLPGPKGDSGPLDLPMGDKPPMGLPTLPKLPEPDLGGEGPLGDLMPGKPPMDKPLMDGPPMDGPTMDEVDLGSEVLGKPPKSDEASESKEKEDKPPFPPKPKKDKEDKKDKEEPDMAKEKILAKARELEKVAQDGGDGGEGGGSIGEAVEGTKDLPFKPKKKKEDKEDDKSDKKDKEDKEASMLTNDPKTASNVKVRVTSSRNILASFNDKPLFHAIPSNDVKQDLNALKRLANKVYGWVVYEGVKSAATKCGTTLLAGVDDDVVTNFDSELSTPATKGILEDNDTVAKEEPDSPESEVTNSAEFDTQETPDKVTAGIEEGGVEVTKEKQDKKPSTVTEGNSTVHQEELKTPTKDVRDDAEVDFQSVKASYKKLYAARALKEIKEANAKFVEKFVTCMQIASSRMRLNHDVNPYKAASLDVLLDQNIQFNDGSEFTGMFESDAKEITEHIAAAGQDKFVEQLFARTADLMDKSDDYIADLHSDLENLSVKPVEVKVAKQASTPNSKSEELKKAANDGNFVLNTENIGTPVTGSSTTGTEDGVRAAVGGTLLSRRANTLEQLSNCKSDDHSKE